MRGIVGLPQKEIKCRKNLQGTLGATSSPSGIYCEIPPPTPTHTFPETYAMTELNITIVPSLYHQKYWYASRSCAGSTQVMIIYCQR